MALRVRNGLAAVRPVLMVLCLSGLAACAGTPGSDETSAPAAPAVPTPDYATAGDHFASLQQAGLSGDYAGFARHLKAEDAKPVVDALRRSFRGGPFDVYTRKSSDAGQRFQRLVELRSTMGRLYLYVAMDRVPGGWVISSHELDRNRAVIMAKL